jgi:hypothetical protein
VVLGVRSDVTEMRECRLGMEVRRRYASKRGVKGEETGKGEAVGIGRLYVVGVDFTKR